MGMVPSLPPVFVIENGSEATLYGFLYQAEFEVLQDIKSPGIVEKWIAAAQEASKITGPSRINHQRIHGAQLQAEVGQSDDEDEATPVTAPLLSGERNATDS